MAWTYSFHNQQGGTNCYKAAVQHARMLARKLNIAILVLFHGKQTGLPRNKTADPRRVSFYVRPNGDFNFAKTPDDCYIEPMGAKNITWT